jgi:hypothetical protein
VENLGEGQGGTAVEQLLNEVRGGGLSREAAEVVALDFFAGFVLVSFRGGKASGQGVHGPELLCDVNGVQYGDRLGVGPINFLVRGKRVSKAVGVAGAVFMVRQ